MQITILFPFDPKEWNLNSHKRNTERTLNIPNLKDRKGLKGDSLPVSHCSRRWTSLDNELLIIRQVFGNKRRSKQRCHPRGKEFSQGVGNLPTKVIPRIFW